MGRHTVPGSGRPEPDLGFWLQVLALVAVAALVGGYLLTRDGDDAARTQTAGPTATAGATTSAPASSPSPTTPGSTTASPSPTTTPATTTNQANKKAPTLRFVVKRPSWITVRVPGGRTLISRQFAKGAKRSFDQRVLEVVNGRPSAVDFYVNGKLRKAGPPDETETFTVRRR